MVARPNAWQKGVKETTAPGTRAITPANTARQTFFAEVLNEVVRQRTAIRLPKRGADSWIAFASGPFGYWSISFDRENRCQVEAYLDLYDKPLTKALFDEMAAEAGRWAAETGLQLDWQRRENRRSSRIVARSEPVPLDDIGVWRQTRIWAVSATLAMYDALNDSLRTRAARLRDVGRTIEPTDVSPTSS